MGLTVTEDTPADMLAGNMELLVQLPPRMDGDYENDDVYDGDEEDRVHQHHRNHHRHHNHHHANGHHPRRTVNSNARRVTVARSTPMMDLLVQVATSQKLSASSYTLEAIGEHGLVLTHHPNTPIGALDALQVKLLPKQGTFVPMKTRHVNQPFEQTFRLQVHLPRNQLYVSRVSSRMNLGKILDEVCREKNLDRNNYELRHPANIEEILDLSLSLQDYHLQEVTLCPKRRTLGSSLSSQDIMALQRQEERRRQEAKQSVFGFVFKKSKESSLSTDSLGERSVSPARSDGTGRSVSPQAPTAPTRPQRKRRPAPKPPIPRAEPEQNANPNIGLKESERDREKADRIIVISHSRNSSDSSGYHEASVLSDNLDSNIRVPETLPRRSKLQATVQESSGRTLAESSHASKSLGNLAAVPPQRTITRGISNSSLSSTGLRKKKAAPPPPQSRPLSSAISTQALERIIDSEESLTSVSEPLAAKASSDVTVALERNLIDPRTISSNEDEGASGTPKKTEAHVGEKIKKRESYEDSTEASMSPEASPTNPSIPSPQIVEAAIIPKVETASERKRAIGVAAPVPKPRASINKLEKLASPSPLGKKIIRRTAPTPHLSSPVPNHVENILRLGNPRENLVRISRPRTEEEIHQHPPKLNKESNDETPRPTPRSKTSVATDVKDPKSPKTSDENGTASEFALAEVEAVPGPPIVRNLRAIGAGDDADIKGISKDVIKIPKKPRRKTLEKPEAAEIEEAKKLHEEPRLERKTNDEVEDKEVRKNIGLFGSADKIPPGESVTKAQGKIDAVLKVAHENWCFAPKIVSEPKRVAPVSAAFRNRRKGEFHKSQKELLINEKARSCAVISTIPKCDIFQAPIEPRMMIGVGEKGRRRPADEVVENSSLTSMDSSLGSSFGTSRSILSGNYEGDLGSNGAPSMTTDLASSESDDELELENIEMFERSRNLPNISNLLRSHSDLNNFEINTLEDIGRHLTSRSVDYTFALNPNLAMKISQTCPEKMFERHVSLYEVSSTSRKNSRHNLVTGTMNIPAFLASSITWEKQELSRGTEDEDAQEIAWTTGESEILDLVEDSGTLSTKPIKKAEETTIDLLKKVSDTLSGSLRSPTVAATSSLANEQQSNTHCVDQPGPKIGRPKVNEPKEISEANENPGNIRDLGNEGDSADPIESNFPSNCQTTTIIGSTFSTASDPPQNITSKNIDPIASSIDWEYPLPEPPTAFRDTNKVEHQKNLTSVSSSKTFLTTEEVSKLERVSTQKHEGTEIAVTKGEIPSSSIRPGYGGPRSRTTSGSSLEIGQDLGVEKTRLSRTSARSLVDSESRRGSQASSTPSVAPVDNILSNFVITTYSKPKNVDIFNEIKERDNEDPHVVSISRKNSGNSGSNGVHTSLLIKETQGDKSEDVSSPRKISQPEVTPKNNEVQSLEKKEDILDSNGQVYNTMNRSNIKISIATKPRPRGDSMNEKQRPKPVLVNVGIDESSNSKEDVKSAEELTREPVVGGNKKFSQWRENILNKQETQTTEKQLRSLQVLRSILPQMEEDKVNPNPSEETRVVDPPSSPNDDFPTEPSLQRSSTVSSLNESPVKRYTYAGPPAINLGSWSERSRTTRVQIKPDNDYKFEKNQSPEVGVKHTPSFKKENHNTTVMIGKTVAPIVSSATTRNSTKFEKEPVIDTREKKESNDVTKISVSRTAIGGFKRPVSTAFESLGTTMLSRKEDNDMFDKINGEIEMQRRLDAGLIRGGMRGEKVSTKKDEEKNEEDIDTRPRNFKELKEAFAKDQNTNTLTMPKYGSYGRPKTENSAIRSASLRKDNNLFLNGENENTLRKEITPVENSRVNHKPVVSVQEKRNFVVIPSINNRNAQDTVNKTNRGNLMPVVKGFKITVPSAEEETNFSQDKRPAYRVAIGDISNGNYVPMQNGLRKTVKIDDFSNGVPKPPTMPVITGVTLKSTNHSNQRPKSMSVEPDTRNMLLESIRNFGGQQQLRRVPRRNTNTCGVSRSLRS